MARFLVSGLVATAIMLGLQTWRLKDEQIAHGETKAVHAELVRQASEESRRMQEQSHEAQRNYAQAQADIAQRDRRIRTLAARLHSAPSAEQLSQFAAAALSEYAADIDRDFAECRERYVDLGTTAAGASAAAWALREAWPQIGGQK
jgi:uncharacterized phage infection (PIP) family protein YhgE